MAEDLHIASGTREEKYASIIPQLEALVTGEKDSIANISNVMSVLKYGMEFFWVGIYFVKENELVLGPFQGPPACTRIQKGKGVCGVCWDEGKTLIVPDVDAFPGHIACSSSSKSEITIPVFKNQMVVAILDVDSDTLNDFSETDKVYLEKIAGILADCM